MKKDKKWLKEKADRLFFDNSISNNPYLVAKREAITEISNLIDQLDESEVLSQGWIDEHAQGGCDEWVYIEDLQNLLVPKRELPVIPKFVADWIDAYNLYGNNPLREYIDLESDFNEGWTDEEDATVYHWINKNPYAFIDALRYGYEVEKEQKYQVIIRDGEYIRLFLCKHGDNVIIGTNDNYIEKCLEVTYLTEQEIKDYDERFWLFAVKVEELEE